MMSTIVTALLVTGVAMAVPGPLYLVALALFGLPHVVWELGFLHSRYRGRWPLRWLMLSGAVLLVHAGLRTANWLEVFSATALQVADLLALLLLMLMLAVSPRGLGWGPRLGALVVGLAIMAALDAGHVAGTLLCLALAHNFTPVGLAWDMARQDPGYRQLAWGASGLFMLPLAMVAVGAAGYWPTPLTNVGTEGLSTPWSKTLAGPLQQAILSAMVVAQCLHYHFVIRVLPASERQRTGQHPLPLRVRQWAIVVSATLAAYFIHDYPVARRLYAVAAGLHAWIEWPILLMTLLAAPSAAQADAVHAINGRPKHS